MSALDDLIIEALSEGRTSDAENARAELAEILETVATQAAQIERMRAVLADYANPDNWVAKEDSFSAGTYFRDDRLMGWEVAAQVMKELEPKP